MKLKEIIELWKRIYTNWKYSTSLIIIAIMFYSFNVLIQNRNYLTIAEFYKNHSIISTLKLFSLLFIGLESTTQDTAFLLLILNSLLVGILFTLLIFKARARHNHQKDSEKQGILAVIGIILGIAAPGCAACGIGLLALLGVGGTFLASLPFHGLEISVVATLILALTVYYISKSMLECKLCRIKAFK